MSNSTGYLLQWMDAGRLQMSTWSPSVPSDAVFMAISPRILNKKVHLPRIAAEPRKCAWVRALYKEHGTFIHGKPGYCREGAMSQPQGQQRTYQNTITVSVVILLMGLAAACTQYKASTILTAIAPAFSLSGSAASWVMSIFTFVGIFVALPSGKAAQRFGFKKTMVISAAIMVLGSLIGLFSGHNGAVLIISRAIEGAMLTCITVCAPIAIRECVPPERMGTGNGIWGCWGNGGAVIACLLTPQIFEVAGFTGVWVVFTVFTAIVAAVFALYVKAPDKDVDLGEAYGRIAAEAADGQEDAGSYKEFLRKDNILFLVAFVCMNIIMLALLGLLPSILQLPEKGFSMSLAGFATTLASLLALVSSPVFGMLADKMGRVKPLLILTLFVLGPCLLVMYTQTGTAFWIAVCVLGLVGFGCVGLLVVGWMQLMPRPQVVAKGMGLFTFVQCVGQFLGTFLVQLLLGPSYGNYVLAGIVLMAVGFIGTGALALTKLK